MLALVFSALALVALEATSYGVLRILESKYLIYRTPVPPPGRTPGDYADYLVERNDLLGWPSTSEYGGEMYDDSGARRSPACDAMTGGSCVSLYGESFTFGGEVDHESAWGNVLAGLLGCRVANYGVSGYGTDQALLRYRSNADDDSPVVVLGFLQENILRNLTRCRDLLTGVSGYALKPRFVLGPDSSLQLVPLPELTEQEYRRVLGIQGPLLVLDHESFYPGSGIVVARRWPFTLSAIRAFHDFRMSAKLRDEPQWTRFYDRDDPRDGLGITAAIIQAFVDEARTRKQMPFVVVFANEPDIHYFRKAGRFPCANLVEDLESRGIHVLDFGAQLERSTRDRELHPLFMPRGHYGEEINRMLAEFVRDNLVGADGRPLDLARAPSSSQDR